MIVKNNEIIEHTKRMRSLLRRNSAFNDWETRLDIMTSQLGDAVEFYKVYSKAYDEDENIVNGYEAEGMLALANLTVQLEMFCIRKGIDFNELRDLGYEHLLLKMKEVHEKGGRMI